MGNPQAKNIGCAMVDGLFPYKPLGQLRLILPVIFLAVMLSGCGSRTPENNSPIARGRGLPIPGADNRFRLANYEGSAESRLPWIIGTAVISTAFLSLLVFFLRDRREKQRVTLILRNRVAELEKELVPVHKSGEPEELMLNAVPLVCSLWDKNFICVDCNREALRFFGLKKKWQFRESFFDYSPEFQNDGQRSRVQLVSNIQKAFTEGAYTFIWTHQNPDGTLFSVEVTLVRVTQGDDYLVAASAIDLREYTRVKKEEAARADAAAEPPARADKKPESEPMGGGLKIENAAGREKLMFTGDILICEDNTMNQRVIVEHLARVGLTPEIAENGSEGIAKVKSRVENGEKPFDLILMDIYMPVMGGIEAAPKIIRLGTGAPVVAMTTNITVAERELYKKAGMDDYIGKPFMPWELKRCLLKYLKPAGFAGVKEKQRDKHGDEEFQTQLKADFARSNKTKFEEISAAVNSGDITLAHRLAHSLKSSAGLIAKPALQKAAADIETALKTGQNPVSEILLDVLKTELDKTLNELNPPLAETDGGHSQLPRPSGAAAFNAQKAREVIEKLEPLLKSGSPECLNYNDELRLIPGSEELIQQIEDFYFGAAEIILGELKKKMEEEGWAHW